MAHQDLKTDIQNILDDDMLPRDEKIKLLETMRVNARSEMRAATESAMVDDNETGDDLALLDRALETLSADTASIEDGGAATL
ncbi:MAG: hypothetical protein VR78_13095 [Hoeflea sp. BRH_c9]|nr:MAG: hypothetical protein VR78_13095 [Hoeflea sp. BRH_c9]